MNHDLKIEWVAALRSGNYQQGQGVLRSADDSMCCLGVLRHVMDPTCSETHENGQYMPSAMQLLAGLTYTQQNQLALMNDKGKSFAEIADWIEANL